MKILLLITNLGAGGAQRVFSEQSNFLKGKFEISEAVFDKNESKDLYKTGNPQYSLDSGKANGLAGKVSRLFRRARALRQLVASQAASVCISHMDGANWVNVLSRSRAKKILVVHGTVLHDKDRSWFFQWLRRRLIIPTLYNRADHTVAVSEGIVRELKHYCGIRKVTCIPNAFDIAGIEAAAQEDLSQQEKALFENHMVLINSGRFHVQKKQRFLFPVFNEVKKQYPSVKLVLLGDGALRDEIIREAGHAGLRYYSIWNREQVFSTDYDVYFLGYASNPFKYLSRSALFLFPSGWEGFPLALCEAMISGVPVLASDCPTGPREILAPGTHDDKYSLVKKIITPQGVLLPMTDKQTFVAECTEAVGILLSDPATRRQMISQAKARMKNYEKQEIVRQWFNLIDTICGKPYST